MTCLPCAKEIINNSAAHAVDNLTKIARQVPDYVEKNRVSARRAETFLSDAIQLEERFCYDVKELLAHFLDDVKNPWDAR